MAREKTFATWRENINRGNIWREESAFCLASDLDSILRIKQSNISAEEIPENAVRMDAEYSNPDAEHKIYAWLTEDGTMHYWTDADMTRMTDESCSLFSKLSNVTEIDMSGIDTSDMRNMGWMFAGCSSLKSLSLSSLDTSGVTNMSHMFLKCKSLEALDLSSFETSKVTDMSDMFDGCESLSSLDLSSWDTSGVTDMRFMFYGCEKLNPFLPPEMAEACGMPALAKSNHEQKNKAARRRNRDQHER